MRVDPNSKIEKRYEARLGRVSRNNSDRNTGDNITLGRATFRVGRRYFTSNSPRVSLVKRGRINFPYVIIVGIIIAVIVTLIFVIKGSYRRSEAD